VKEMEQIIEMK